jgi:CHAT domain-containing protein/tetratricopeptide (TPR) repeat protein
MNCPRKLLVAASLCAALLLGAAVAHAQSATLREQIAQHEQKLVEARAEHRVKDEGTQLIALGYLYRQSGQMQKALDALNQALAVEQSVGGQATRAMTLNTMGKVYSDMGQQKKALELFGQALPIWQTLGVRAAEANTHTYIGRSYNELGQRQDALQHLNQAMSIWQQVATQPQGLRHRSQLGLTELMDLKRLKDAMPNLQELVEHAGRANTLDNLGKTYSDMGQGQQGLEYLKQALPIWREAGERNGEALTLNDMGRTCADLGQKQNALDYYHQALTLWRTIGNRQGEAMTLNSIGRLYRDLGQQQTALEYYNQTLPIWREVQNRNGEAMALNDIGRVYADLGQGQKALEYFDQALPIWHETGARRGEAMTLNNAGRVWSDMHEPEKALVLDAQALVIWREVEDRRGEALALMSLGWAYYAQKQIDQALASELSALALAKAVGDPEVEGVIETSLMVGFREEHHPEEAILFGTAAVNSFQLIRRNISGLEKDLQTGFVQSKSFTYRMLAELLVQSGRLGEAEQVLDLLKEQELKEVVRGAMESAASTSRPLAMSGAQQKAASELISAEKTATALTDMNVEMVRLQSKPERTPEEVARLKVLETKIEAANAQVAEFFRKTLYPELAQRSGAQDANALLSREKSEVSRLQNTLSRLGPRVIGIRLLLGEEHAYAIVVTPQARRKYELAASPAELRSKVLQVRDELRRPSSNPKPDLAELYMMVVAPLTNELASLEQNAQGEARAPVLLWSLDGVMRYVPMSALFDGSHYLVERFNNVLFTPESYGHMAASDAGKPALQVLAMGLSKSYGGLPALPGVLPELDAVVQDPAVPESHGPMHGRLFFDDHFTYAALKEQLGAGAGFPVVHLASHFVLETGSDAEPYLMLGGENAGDTGGFPLTLSRIEESTISFQQTRLLTLSACSTAKGDVAKDGLEMDSLGMIAQQKGADSVLATLWDVNDASTSRLMSDFYLRWVKSPALGKAEALRQAQLAFLREQQASQPVGHRGVQTVEDDSAATRVVGYVHPFYWAAFILIGNYQ